MYYEVSREAPEGFTAFDLLPFIVPNPCFKRHSTRQILTTTAVRLLFQASFCSAHEDGTAVHTCIQCVTLCLARGLGCRAY